jgi:hypothetical protein
MPDCQVLNPLHLMIGCDFHKAISPSVPPIIVPFALHNVFQILNGLNTCVATVPKVLAWNFMTMNRGTDIGMGISHIPTVPNILLPIMFFGSGSISEFGAFTVLSGGAPIATACIPSPPFSPLGININLNCGDVPTPTGFVFAPNTVLAGMKIGDYFGSLSVMCFDIVAVAALNALFGGYHSKTIKFGGLTDLKCFNRLIGRFISSPVWATRATGAVGLVTSWFTTGNPMGYSYSRNKTDNDGNKVEDPTFLGQQGSTIFAGDAYGTGYGLNNLKENAARQVAECF